MGAKLDGWVGVLAPYCAVGTLVLLLLAVFDVVDLA